MLGRVRYSSAGNLGPVECATLPGRVVSARPANRRAFYAGRRAPVLVGPLSREVHVATVGARRDCAGYWLVGGDYVGLIRASSRCLYRMCNSCFKATLGRICLVNTVRPLPA